MPFEPNVKLINASAGTGKTYRIIEELGASIKNTEANNIIAVTFTKAAAKELRKKLESVSKDIYVNTIHGFFASLLRQHALKLGQSASFKIIEELQERTLFERTASNILINKAKIIDYHEFIAEYDLKNIIETLFKMEKNYSRIYKNLSTNIKELVAQEKQAEFDTLKELLNPAAYNATRLILEIKGPSGDKLEEKRKSILDNVKELIPIKDR